MEPILGELARFVAETPASAVPEDVLARAALIVADTVGAVLGGSREPEPSRLHASRSRAPGPATVLATGFPRVEPWWAIVANGTAGTMLELDEGNRFARGHPGIHVVPAALAEAERLDAGGSALLLAVILGYDVAARLGAAAPVRPAMHMHGIHGVAGAAAAVARLRRLDTRKTASALAVAAGLTLGTSWRAALGGATVRNLYAGVGGAHGWLAVDLAEAGFTGQPDMLTETYGRISGAALDPAVALDGIGRRFEVMRNYFKRYACCRYNHAAIEALEGLLAVRALEPDWVEAIRVETYAAAATMADRAPAGSLGAKFSIPYALAARLVLGDTGPDAFREPALSDPRVRALAARVEVVEDPRLTARLPVERPARVTVRLAGGATLVQEVATASGDFDRPYDRATLETKFLALAAPVLGPRAREAWRLAGALGGLASARELGLRLRAMETAAPPATPR
jgi:2-methylcitrate dehydratase PrpD